MAWLECLGISAWRRIVNTAYVKANVYPLNKYIFVCLLDLRSSLPTEFIYILWSLILRRFQWVLEKYQDHLEASNVPEGSQGWFFNFIFYGVISTLGKVLTPVVPPLPKIINWSLVCNYERCLWLNQASFGKRGKS